MKPAAVVCTGTIMLILLSSRKAAAAKFLQVPPESKKVPRIPPPKPNVGPRQIDNWEKSVLSPFIPSVDLDAAVLHVGEMPFYTEVNVDIDGITRDNDIYFKDPSLTFRTAHDLALLAHELVHVGQYKNGMTWASYLWAARNGYEESEFEVPAYAMTHTVFNYLKNKGFP